MDRGTHITITHLRTYKSPFWSPPTWKTSKTIYSLASHLRSNTVHCFQVLWAFHWLHFQVAESCSFLWNPAARFPSFTPSTPNTKPLPLQGRFRSAPNSGRSKQSSLWGPRPRPDMETNDCRNTKRRSTNHENLQDDVSGCKNPDQTTRRLVTHGSSILWCIMMH